MSLHFVTLKKFFEQRCSQNKVENQNRELDAFQANSSQLFES